MISGTASSVRADHAKVQEIIRRLLGQEITGVERIGGGRNSRIYRVTCESSDQYVVKRYFRDRGDQRDRLRVEFSSLRFLWEHGVRCVPQAVAADQRAACAVYEHVAGRQVASREVQRTEIDEAVEFLMALRALKDQPGSRDLPLASEACLSVQTVLDQIKERSDRLSSVAGGGALGEALQKFLRREFAPAVRHMTRWSRLTLRRAGVSPASSLPDEERTLSPSDFGFHNALRRSDGRLSFLDFEYFGWDDPAKLVADFLLHPQMALSMGLKQRFTHHVISRFEGSARLAARVEGVYPLFGLKWCLILLNEFLPAQWLRRRFASPRRLAQETVQMNQLAKAQAMLHHVQETYERFPYFSRNSSH